MIYELLQFLGNVTGARLMTYISFRAIVAGVMGLCISIWVGRWFIELLKRKNISETDLEFEKLALKTVCAEMSCVFGISVDEAEYILDGAFMEK